MAETTIGTRRHGIAGYLCEIASENTSQEIFAQKAVSFPFHIPFDVCQEMFIFVVYIA